MSRLDSFIRRMTAQRDILDDLATRLDGIDGFVFEFGLGSGRTYDHLCEKCPDRRIVVFESDVNDNMRSRPLPPNLVIGDLRETVLRFADGCAALIHVDIETGVAEQDAKLAAWLPALVARCLVPGGFAASGAPLPDVRLAPEPLPAGIAEGRYSIVRRR